MTATAILHWIEANCRTLIIQQLPASARRKNRVMLQYSAQDNQSDTVGAVNLSSAVQRAQSRIAASERKAS